MLRRTVPEMVGTTATLSNGRAATLGKLKLVPAGTIIPDPGEVIDDDRLTPILTTLAEQFDYVLLDAPPFLAVGDAPALSARVDGIVVVARLGVVSAAQLHDLEHQLETCQAAKLGFVAAGADVEARYDNAGYYHAAAKADREEHSTLN
jgi:Mrp family chromosome partitioning ATPase